MNIGLLSGFWCEVQRSGERTVFERLRWTPDNFQFENGGVVLKPGNYSVTLYSGGETVFTTVTRVRSTDKTLVAVFFGGLNPRRSKGEFGTVVYSGTPTEYSEAVAALASNRV